MKNENINIYNEFENINLKIINLRRKKIYFKIKIQRIKKMKKLKTKLKFAKRIIYRR